MLRRKDREEQASGRGSGDVAMQEGRRAPRERGERGWDGARGSHMTSARNLGVQAAQTVGELGCFGEETQGAAVLKDGGWGRAGWGAPCRKARWREQSFQ